MLKNIFPQLTVHFSRPGGAFRNFTCRRQVSRCCADPEMQTDVGEIAANPEEVQLVHDLASLVDVLDASCSVYFTLQAAVVPLAELHNSQTPAFKLVEKEHPIICCPFIVCMAEGNDLCCAAFKHRNDISYYYGISVEKVWSMLPPGPVRHFVPRTRLRS